MVYDAKIMVLAKTTILPQAGTCFPLYQHLESNLHIKLIHLIPLDFQDSQDVLQGKCTFSRDKVKGTSLLNWGEVEAEYALHDMQATSSNANLAVHDEHHGIHC